MRLETAVLSSIQGINAHGLAIAVIGDNLANVNTTAGKSSRPEFSSLLSEGFDGSSTSAEPSTGSGVRVSDIRVVQELGPIEDTGRALDVAVDGPGFFIIGDETNRLYSRAGDFSINEEGILVNSKGLAVQGFAPGGTTLQNLNLLNVNISATATTTLAIAGNIDARLPTTTAPTTAPATFSELYSNASYSSVVSPTDSLGQKHSVSLVYYKTGAGTFTVQAYIDGADVGGTAGVPTKLGSDATLTFNTSGGIDAANQAAATLSLNPAYSNGAAAGNFTINLASFTSTASPSAPKTLVDNGKSVGSVNEFQVEPDGEILAVLDNGQNVSIGTIALAKFPNVDGLEKAGDNMMRTTTTTGDPTVSAAGSGGTGALRGFALERSTVDIATEFSEMILFQRGYQANSQALKSASDLMQQTLALIG